MEVIGEEEEGERKVIGERKTKRKRKKKLTKTKLKQKKKGSQRLNGMSTGPSVRNRSPGLNAGQN